MLTDPGTCLSGVGDLDFDAKCIIRLFGSVLGAGALGPRLEAEALGSELCSNSLFASLTALALLGGGNSSFTALILLGCGVLDCGGIKSLAIGADAGTVRALS